MAHGSGWLSPRWGDAPNVAAPRPASGGGAPKRGGAKHQSENGERQHDCYIGDAAGAEPAVAGEAVERVVGVGGWEGLGEDLECACHALARHEQTAEQQLR